MEKYRPSVLPIAVIHLLNCVIILLFSFLFHSLLFFFILTSEVVKSNGHYFQGNTFMAINLKIAICHCSSTKKDKKFSGIPGIVDVFLLHFKSPWRLTNGAAVGLPHTLPARLSICLPIAHFLPI